MTTKATPSAVAEALGLSESPAQRLTQHGATVLTTTELLSLFLTHRTPLDQAAKLWLAADSDARKLNQLHLAEVGAIVGRGNAVRLKAALELGRRIAAAPRDRGQMIRSPKDVVAMFASQLEDAPVEEFHVLALDSQHRLERDILISRGILNSSLVHPREVFREAIATRAAAVILLHNHPSGDPTPSADDRAVTEQLVAAGRLLDIPVHDHVIIGRGTFASFAAEGLL